MNDATRSSLSRFRFRLLRQPGNRLRGPNTRRITLLKFFGDLAQLSMIVRRLVPRHALPIHCFRREMGLAKLRNHVVIPALGVGIFLVYECDPAETAVKGSEKIRVRQIAFQPYALLALRVEEKHRRRPHRFKAVEPRWMFLDVGLDWNKILLDEVDGLVVLVGLGVQPSTSSSCRRRAEVEQNGPIILFGCHQGLIDVCAPIYGHICLRVEFVALSDAGGANKVARKWEMSSTANRTMWGRPPSQGCPERSRAQRGRVETPGRAKLDTALTSAGVPHPLRCSLVGNRCIVTCAAKFPQRVAIRANQSNVFDQPTNKTLGQWKTHGHYIARGARASQVQCHVITM